MRKGFAPGQSGNPNGRPKGAEGKVKKAVREAFQELIENNTENLSRWLSETAKSDPKAAIEIIIKLAEFVIPKYSRVDDISIKANNSPAKPITDGILADYYKSLPKKQSSK